LLSATLLQHWPHVCRIKITFTKVLTNRLVSTPNFDDMRCNLDSTENPRSFEKYPTPPSENHKDNHSDFSRKSEICIQKIKIFIDKIIEKIMKEIIKKLLKSLPAGFKSTVQETCQILECGFYLPVFLCRNATVLSGESYKTQSK